MSAELRVEQLRKVFSSGNPPVAKAAIDTVSFTMNVQPILALRCAGPCHNPTAPPMGLIMSPGLAYNYLVNVNAVEDQPITADSGVQNVDDSGVFDLTDLPAGRYTLTVSKSGFVALSYGQRALSTPARTLRRRVSDVSAQITFSDGREQQLGRADLLAPLEQALRFFVWATGAVALAMALAAR